MRQLTSKLTKEKLEEMLKTPNGKRRLLDLNETTIKVLNEDIANLKSEIKNVESIAISWINITIVLAIFQILPLGKNEISDFIFICLPSFIILVYFTAFALLKSPTLSRTAYPILENEDLDMRLMRSGVEKKHLEKVIKMLQTRLDKKMFLKKFIGPAVMINFTVSIIFIILKTFAPSLLTQNFNIITGAASVISIPILTWKLSLNKSLTTSIPLNAQNLSDYLLE